MRVLYLLWNAFFCLGMLLSVLKRHDTPSTSIPSAPCLVVWAMPLQVFLLLTLSVE
jgi:hypothetical protein